VARLVRAIGGGIPPALIAEDNWFGELIDGYWSSGVRDVIKLT
jgi:hypothetical protein